MKVLVVVNGNEKVQRYRDLYAACSLYCVGKLPSEFIVKIDWKEQK